MGPRPYMAALAAAMVTVLSVAGCTDDEPGATFVDGEQCAGFTPVGSRLDDQEMLDAAVAEWRDYENSDSQRGPALDDDAEVCVVYADVNESGLPRVVMVSEDVGGINPFAAFFEGTEEDDFDVAHIAGARFLGDDSTAIGVGDGLWLLADGVEAAVLHSGSPTSAHELDLSESRLVDSRELGVTEGRSEGVLIAETAGGTVVAASAGEDAHDRVAAVPLVDSPLAPTSVLESANGAAVLADAIRAARSDPQSRPPDFQLLGAVDVPDVGTALASATTSDRGLASPVLSIGTPADVRSVPIGREASERLDTTIGWAAGTMIVDRTDGPLAYVVAAQPPVDVDGAVQLDVRVGSTRHELTGPVAFAPADGSASAAVIGTAPSGVVVPTVPTESAVTVDLDG